MVMSLVVSFLLSNVQFQNISVLAPQKGLKLPGGGGGEGALLDQRERVLRKRFPWRGVVSFWS